MRPQSINGLVGRAAACLLALGAVPAQAAPVGVTVSSHRVPYTSPYTGQCAEIGSSLEQWYNGTIAMQGYVIELKNCNRSTVATVPAGNMAIKYTLFNTTASRRVGGRRARKSDHFDRLRVH